MRLRTSKLKTIEKVCLALLSSSFQPIRYWRRSWSGNDKQTLPCLLNNDEAETVTEERNCIFNTVL